MPVNYIPAITKQHTYNLAATLYPYATVVQGEVGWSAEVFYTIPRKSKLGGKYGTKISFQYATASSLDTTNLSGVDGVVDGYDPQTAGGPAANSTSATSTSTSAENSRRTSRPSTPISISTSTPSPPRSPQTSRAS